MVKQFLQATLEFIKEIWFQMDSLFYLESTEAFKFLKPYLIQLQDNPLYMVFSVVALFLAPYTLIKIRSISKEREHKLNKLMEEMEKKGEGLESEFEEFELESPSSGNEETIDIGKNAETVNSQLTESEFEKDLAKSDISEEPESEIDDFKLEPETSDLSFPVESMELEEVQEPELDTERSPSADEHVSPRKLDSLIDQLKFLQARFENPYQQLTERSSSPSTEKNIPEKNYASENFIEHIHYSSASAGLHLGSKKYMDLLESFIFMKDQKKHK